MRLRIPLFGDHGLQIAQAETKFVPEKRPRSRALNPQHDRPLLVAPAERVSEFVATEALPDAVQTRKETKACRGGGGTTLIEDVRKKPGQCRLRKGTTDCSRYQGARRRIGSNGTARGHLRASRGLLSNPDISTGNQSSGLVMKLRCDSGNPVSQYTERFCGTIRFSSSIDGIPERHRCSHPI
jgi:hypothetical protein